MQKQTNNPSQLRVISWNVRFSTFVSNNQYVIDGISSLGDFDVVCLQEYVQGGDQQLHRWLVEQGYRMTFLPFSHNVEHGHGLLTATKSSIAADTQSVMLRSTPPRPLRPFFNERGLLATTIQTPTTNIEIDNVHLTVYRPHLTDLRRAEFEALCDYLDLDNRDHNSNDNAPTHQVSRVLCGDMNPFIFDDRLQRLKTAYAHATGGRLHKTWRHFGPKSPIRANLDYVFWDRTHLHVDAQMASLPGSDHRPIVFSVTSAPQHRLPRRLLLQAKAAI